ncbi:sperm receptor for egg jelly-like [Ptychodera flava]|uniref:sperm receptor for egg jelly-like n=1 Tax=Ptychodera flava TaxID=63121 RepID=UPI00396A3584
MYLLTLRAMVLSLVVCPCLTDGTRLPIIAGQPPALPPSSPPPTTEPPPIAASPTVAAVVTTVAPVVGTTLQTTIHKSDDTTIERTSGTTLQTTSHTTEASVLQRIANMTNGDISNFNRTRIIGVVDDLAKFTSNLTSREYEETIEQAKDILNAIEEITQISIGVDGTRDKFTISETQMIIDTFVNIADDIGTSVLEKTEPGSGAITLKTTSLTLHVEKDTASDLCNSSIKLSANSGFEIPSVESILGNTTHDTVLNLISFRFGSSVLNVMQEAGLIYDFVSLSLKFLNGTDVEGNDMNEDLKVWLGKQSTLSEDTVTIVGHYEPEEEVTYYSWQINDLREQHAVHIGLASNVHLMENSTLCMLEFESSTRRGDCKFDTMIEFKGMNSHIFIPETEISMTGNHTFRLGFLNDRSQSLNVTISVKIHGCLLMEENTGDLRQDGCKVSPMSTINSTLCLCRRL